VSAGAAPGRGGGLRDVSASAVTAGLLAVLVSCAGPLLILSQAAQAMGVGAQAFSSWVFATLVSAGLACIGLSLWLRAPVLVAWSAPGAVLLISAGPALSPGEVSGAYLVTAAAILAIGASGLFDRIVALVPRAVASGMMAGILFRFGAEAMGALGAVPLAFAVLLAAFLVLQARLPRMVMPIVLFLALALSWGIYEVPLGEVGLRVAQPFVTRPVFSAQALLGLALPLVVVTLTGQFLGGLAVLRSNGFAAPARPILVVASLAALPAALMGGITTALASITMALGAGPEAHPDPSRRYVAGVACGVFFCLAGVFGGSIVAALTLLPGEVIALLAGLALLGPIGRGLSEMMADPQEAQAGLLTFVVTASGASLWGLGGSFWGIVVGIAAVALRRVGRPAAAQDQRPISRGRPSETQGT